MRSTFSGKFVVDESGVSHWESSYHNAVARVREGGGCGVVVVRETDFEVLFTGGEEVAKCRDVATPDLAF